MEKIVYEKGTYYFNDGVVYDENFIAVPSGESKKILRDYYRGDDYKNLGEADFLARLKNLKAGELFGECLEAIDFGLAKFCGSTNFYRIVLPMVTSCHRMAGNPQKAIDFWNENKAICSEYASGPLMTSLAAAYCDVGNYELAKKFANRAYAIQGGSKDYATELSLVYQRIKNEVPKR